MPGFFLMIFPYFLSAGLLVVLYDRVKRPATLWLVSMAGAGFSWFWILFLGIQKNVVWRAAVPVTKALLGNDKGLVFTLNHESWGFLVAVATIVLVILAVDVVDLTREIVSGWAALLGMAGASVLVVTSGNLLAAIYAWAFLSILYLVIMLGTMNIRYAGRSILTTFGLQMAGILLLVVGYVFWGDDVAGNVPQQLLVLIVLASIFFLGEFQAHDLFLQETNFSRMLGIGTRLIVLNAVLAFLVHYRFGASTWSFSAFFYLAGCFLVLRRLLEWLLSRDLLVGRPSWATGMFALTLTMILAGAGDLAVVFGQGIVFAGMVVFLVKAYGQSNKWVVYSASLLVSVFPYMFSKSGFVVPLFSRNHLTLWEKGMLAFVFYLFFSVFIAGMLWLDEKTAIVYKPHTTKSIVIWGFILLAQVFVWAGTMQSENTPGRTWWEGVVPLVCGVVIYRMYHRFRISRQVVSAVERVYQPARLKWLAGALGGVVRIFEALFLLFAKILEGDAGFLWALLAAGLMIAFWLHG